MSFDLRASDLAKLSSLTKYPSIATYHTLENGILSEEAMPFTGTVYATEKIDGTNARPKGIDAMHQFLQQTIPQSQATLDRGGGGRPEGLVLRTVDRSRIAKARFEDYERTIKRRKR